MGDPKKPRKMYSRPFKIWNRERLDTERPLITEFGLKNKQELWATDSMLRKYTGQAKRLIAGRGEQTEIEKRQLLGKLSSLGLIDSKAALDDVLGLQPSNFLSRRLQTIVYKKNFARSVNQARQFITHEHIMVNGRVITSPSYLVPVNEEASVTFVESSKLADSDHPERAPKVKKVVPDPKEVKEPVKKTKPAEKELAKEKKVSKKKSAKRSERPSTETSKKSKGMPESPERNEVKDG